MGTGAATNEKEAAKLLQEAQANLEFSTDTGYAPELRRNFSLISLLGVGFGITNSWFGISGMYNSKSLIGVSNKNSFTNMLHYRLFNCMLSIDLQILLGYIFY